MKPKYEMKNGDNDSTTVVITEGDFAGTEYQYSTLKFAGEDEHGNMRVEYSYAVLGSPTFMDDARIAEFEIVAAEILNEILLSIGNES